MTHTGYDYCHGSREWPEGTTKGSQPGRAVCGLCGKDVAVTRWGANLRAHVPPREASAAVAGAPTAPRPEPQEWPFGDDNGEVEP